MLEFSFGWRVSFLKFLCFSGSVSGSCASPTSSSSLEIADLSCYFRDSFRVFPLQRVIALQSSLGFHSVSLENGVGNILFIEVAICPITFSKPFKDEPMSLMVEAIFCMLFSFSLMRYSDRCIFSLLAIVNLRTQSLVSAV